MLQTRPEDPPDDVTLQMSQNARVRGNPNLYVPEKKGTEGKFWLQVQVSAGVFLELFHWQTALKLCSSLVQQTFLCRNKHIPKSPMAWPGPCPHPGQESNLGQPLQARSGQLQLVFFTRFFPGGVPDFHLPSWNLIQWKYRNFSRGKNLAYLREKNWIHHS